MTNKFEDAQKLLLGGLVHRAVLLPFSNFQKLTSTVSQVLINSNGGMNNDNAHDSKEVAEAVAVSAKMVSDLLIDYVDTFEKNGKKSVVNEVVWRHPLSLMFSEAGPWWSSKLPELVLKLGDNRLDLAHDIASRIEKVSKPIGTYLEVEAKARRWEWAWSEVPVWTAQAVAAEGIEEFEDYDQPSGKSKSPDLGGLKLAHVDFLARSFDGTFSLLELKVSGQLRTKPFDRSWNLSGNWQFTGKASQLARRSMSLCAASQISRENLRAELLFADPVKNGPDSAGPCLAWRLTADEGAVDRLLKESMKSTEHATEWGTWENPSEEYLTRLGRP